MKKIAKKTTTKTKNRTNSNSIVSALETKDSVVAMGLRVLKKKLRWCLVWTTITDVCNLVECEMCEFSWFDLWERVLSTLLDFCKWVNDVISDFRVIIDIDSVGEGVLDFDVIIVVLSGDREKLNDGKVDDIFGGEIINEMTAGLLELDKDIIDCDKNIDCDKVDDQEADTDSETDSLTDTDLEIDRETDFDGDDDNEIDGDFDGEADAVAKQGASPRFPEIRILVPNAGFVQLPNSAKITRYVTPVDV